MAGRVRWYTWPPGAISRPSASAGGCRCSPSRSEAGSCSIYPTSSATNPTAPRSGVTDDTTAISRPPAPAGARTGRHDVNLATDSRIGNLLGSRVAVATYHHQAVDLLPDGLVATGWAEDGTIEEFENVTTSWLGGVQWHPEVADGAELFRRFVEVCRSWRDAPPTERG